MEQEIQGVTPAGLDVDLELETIMPGSFVEVQSTQEGDSVDDNHFFKQETFTVQLPNQFIAMPVFFEIKDHKKVSRSLIMDMKSRTIYYQYRGGVFQQVKDGVDSRNISNIQMLNNSDVYINISKNILSVNMENLKEKPMTGVGSFCKSVQNIRVANLNEILLCMTEDSIEAHYNHEKFSATQTKLPIKQTDLADILRTGPIEQMLYCKQHPNYIFML